MTINFPPYIWAVPAKAKAERIPGQNLPGPHAFLLSAIGREAHAARGKRQIAPTCAGAAVTLVVLKGRPDAIFENSLKIYASLIVGVSHSVAVVFGNEILCVESHFPPRPPSRQDPEPSNLLCAPHFISTLWFFTCLCKSH